MLGPDGVPILDARYEKICELLSKLAPASITELGGNMGVFSLAMWMRGVAPHITCSDSDPAAVESAYSLFKRFARGHCTAAMIDFFEDCRSIRVPTVSERYRADTVVALALTHHLILTRGIQGELLMQRIADFCERHAVVEFMPMGLWNGKEGPPVPPWYTLDWFRKYFLDHFELLHEEELAPNRVVLIGRKRSKAE
jgi:hypothetical protein